MPRKGLSLIIALIMSISAIPLADESSGQLGASPSVKGGLAESPWPMFRQNLNHTGLSAYDTSGNPGKLKWISLKDSAPLLSSPSIGSDGTIYVGHLEYKLYAVNPDGTVKWLFATNDSVYSSPAVGSDGTVYVSSDDGKLYAVNPDGTEKWSSRVGQDSGSSPTVGLDGTIYIGSHGGHGGGLYAVNPDGTVKWYFVIRYGVGFSSPAINSDGTIYVGSWDSKLYAINPDGTEKWNFPIGNWTDSSPAIGSDGTIYVGSWDSKLYAINPDGTEKWNFTTGGGVRSSPAIGSDGTVFIGSNDSKYYAINPDGTQKWSFTTGSRIVYSSPAIGSDGTIYVGSDDHKLYAINPDGTQKWSFEASSIWSSPAIDSDGTILVSCMNGKLYAIGKPLNQPPVADAGPDQTVYEGDTVFFDGTGSFIPGGGSGSWSYRADIPLPEAGGASTVLDGEIYYVGGEPFPIGNFSIFQKYNPATDSWSSLPSLPASRIFLGLEAVNGKVYAVGGSDAVDSTNTTFEFDPLANSWTSKAPMPMPMEAFGTAAANDRIYVIGGSSTWVNCYPCGGVFEYDPINDTWSVKPDMPTGRVNLAAVVHDGKIYAIGGEAYGAVDAVEVYDPVVGEWSRRANMTTARMGLAVEALGGRIYAFGGMETWGGPMNLTEMYDPFGDSWTLASPMLEHRKDFGSGAIGSCIYAFSGYGVVPIWLNNTEAYCLAGELTYGWDFDASVDSDGDGNYTNDKDATSPTPTYVYFDDGTYVVTLTVTDSRGLQGRDECDISVLNVPPTPEWTSRSVDGTILNPPYPEGKEILFEATVYDPGIYDTFTYDWDFGDGTILLDAGPSVTHTYGDNDTYIVVLKVTDDDGGVGIDDTPPLSTTNEDPVVTLHMPYCIFVEGTYPCQPMGEFTDPGWLDTHSGVWDYGDGTYQTAVLTEENDPPNATGYNITSHIYGDDGVYNISFTVVDDDGGVGTDWADAYVQNLPPSFTIDIPTSVNEGEDFILGINAVDPGSDDIIISIDWGDGTSESKTYYNNGIGPDPPNSGEGTWPFSVYAEFAHIYGDNGNFSVSVTVEDDDGGSVQDYVEIMVKNLPPEIALPMIPLIFDEGQEFSLSAKAIDPGSDDIEFRWTLELGPFFSAIYYNDGLNPDPPMSPWGTFPFAVTDTVQHTYGDDGIYSVRLTVVDDDLGTTIYEMAVTVNNVVPTGGISGLFFVDEGSPMTFEATATDPGSDDLAFTWNWGDGTPDYVSTYYNDGVGPDPYPSPGGTYPFVATDTVIHTYGDNAPYTLTLTISDDDGGSVVYATTVTVCNVAPIIEPFGPYAVDEGSPLKLETTATDPGSDDLTFTWEFEFGSTITNTYYNDGVGPDPYPSPGGTYPFTATDSINYTYGDNGLYNVTLTVEDDDSGTTTYTTTIIVNNVAPTIEPFGPFVVDEGSQMTAVATANDPGSDDLAFFWEFELGPTLSNIHYNDGIGPDPYPSPEGIYPFSATDRASHTYGDNYDYLLTLSVCDDDGSCASYDTTVTVNNVAPTIEPFGPVTVDEGTVLDLTAISKDVGSDDLTFNWEFELGPTVTDVYYNDGVGPDPYPSPGGTFPFSVADTVLHTYGDNGVFNVTLIVEDDDGGTATCATNITVNNVAPTIDVEAFIQVNFTLRVAGEKWHNVEIYVYEDDEEIGYAEVIRYPGNPDNQTATTGDVICDVTTTITARVLYSPDDDPINGQINGASPAWVTLTFEDGSETRLKHTFNVKHPETWEWNIIVNPYIAGHEISFEATATDPGSDDLTFTWNWGDSTPDNETTYYNDGTGPDPYPSPDGTYPFSAADTVKHAYSASDVYTVTLTVTDDDGGVAVATVSINIP